MMTQGQTEPLDPVSAAVLSICRAVRRRNASLGEISNLVRTYHNKQFWTANVLEPVRFCDPTNRGDTSAMLEVQAL